MKGDFQVRFCERLKLKCFGLLDLAMNSSPASKPCLLAVILKDP